MEELLLFQAGNIQFGLNLPLIREIHSVSAHLEEQAAEGNRPLQAVDGKETPLYDLSSILEQKTTSLDTDSKKVIQIESEGRSLSLAVDRIERVVSVDSVQIKPLPAIFKGLSLSCFPRVLKHKDKLILVLSPKGIERAEQEMLTRKDLNSKMDTTKALHEDEEIIDLVDEVPYVLNNGRMSQDKGWNSELIIHKTASGMPHPVFTQPAERKEMKDSLLDTLSIGEDPENELPLSAPLGETDSPFSDIDHKQAIDPAQLERIVTKMLTEEKLAANVESVVSKMIKEFNVTDKINRIFFQTLETPAVDSPVADREQQIKVIDKLGRDSGSRLKKIIQEKQMNPSDPDKGRHGPKMSVKAGRPV